MTAKLKNPAFLPWILLAVLIAVCAGSVYIGPTPSRAPEILYKIRLPRVLLGALVGLALAASGAILQGLLRNPLADPYILGTSSGAALGALAAFSLRAALPEWFYFSTVLFYGLIFLGAFLATLASYLISRSDGQVPIVNLLLSGVIVSTLCGAFIFLFFTLQHQNSFSLFFFLMGNLVEGNWTLIAISGSIIVAGSLGSLAFARSLDILSLGEEKAQHLGIDVEKLKWILFALTSLIVSASVAISGPIGFVGLIVPHITRLWVGPGHKNLILTSALTGAILLVAADDVARTVANPIEIPVGIIMCLVGAPFFLWLLRRKKKSRVF